MFNVCSIPVLRHVITAGKGCAENPLAVVESSTPLMMCPRSVCCEGAGFGKGPVHGIETCEPKAYCPFKLASLKPPVMEKLLLELLDPQAKAKNSELKLRLNNNLFGKVEGKTRRKDASDNSAGLVQTSLRFLGIQGPKTPARPKVSPITHDTSPRLFLP